MAEDEARSAKSRFKSKWNRVFKEKEEHELTPQHTNSFKLNDDVAEFLQPSIDNAAASTRPPTLAPKLDVSLAQRWPSAHEVRTASAAAEDTPNGYRKPRRREGLAVGFVRTEPEMIGEGGDESEEPPSEVGRRRAMVARSVSERRPSPMGSQLVGAQTTRQPQQQTMSNANEDDFEAPPLRRVQTSYHEYSPSVQKKQVSSPPPADDSPVLPKLSRTPTGFTPQDEDDEIDPVDHEKHPVPRIDTTLVRKQTEQQPSTVEGRREQYSASPRDPVALAARKRELRSGEGMILRRASAMIKDQEMDEEQKRQSVGMGVQLPSQHYDDLSRPDAPSLMPEVPTPRSAISPASRSPFADPKYTKRHSGEVTSDQAPRQPAASQPQAAYQPGPKKANQLPVFAANRRPVADAQLPPPSKDQLPPPAREGVVAERPAELPAPAPSHQPVELPGNIPAQQRPQQKPPPQRQPIYELPQHSSERPPEASYRRPSRNDDQLTSMRTVESSRPAPAHSLSAKTSQNASSSRDASPLRPRIFSEGAGAINSRPNASSGSLNILPPQNGQAYPGSNSRDSNSPQLQQSTGSSMQRSPVMRTQGFSSSPQSGSPRSATSGRPGGSPSSNQNSADSHGWSKAPPPQAPRTTTTMVQQSAGARPGSAGSGSANAAQRPVGATNFSVPRTQPQPTPPQARVVMTQPPDGSNRSVPSETAGSARRPTVSSQPSAESSPAADAAYADFAARVAHMKGVFKLTAEKERPSDKCTPLNWLRTALWWYLRGKSGLEMLLRQRPPSNDGAIRELLTQPHVDLAKAWWILSDPLEAYDSQDGLTPQSASPNSGHPDIVLKQSVAALKSHITSLSLSLSRSHLMPPPSSLIQGQDTRIWLEYPRFTQDVAAVLGGSASRSYLVESSQQGMMPLDALPLGDTRDIFCYGRFPVDVSINTDDPSTDRITLPCMLSILRSRQDFMTTVVIASQSDLLNVKIGPSQGSEKGLTWQDVSWKASSFGMIVRLPRNFDLAVRIHEKDFRSLWNLIEYSRKVNTSLRPEKDERLVHDAQLAELQYADSSNANAFPPDKVRGAMVLVFERTIRVEDGSGARKMICGYRMVLVTDTRHKSLACASHDVCQRGPLYFEFITDAAANGMAAMVIRTREDTRQCRILLVFPDVGSRQNLYDTLNGVVVGPDEAIVGKASLATMNIEPATQVAGFSTEPHPALRALQWHKLGVTSSAFNDPNARVPNTVHSESLRIVARHVSGCVTDRLNLGKGELLVRLPCADTPAIQILRNPQEDIHMSIDTRSSHESVVNGITELSQLVLQQPTIRTYAFASHEDLHGFQTAITGCSVRYDGFASTFSIARRRMVVPIYKKWEAAKVRLQIVSHDTVVQVLAFMEDFTHTDAMCFQVRSTDNFENVKGDGKGKKWAVRMIDAKFSLPHIPENHNDEGEETEDMSARVKRRFVNLEGLDYAEEHDDITIGFETQEDRDKFAQALPAAATVGRGITLKRRT